jgi:hypothetical protein
MVENVDLYFSRLLLKNVTLVEPVSAGIWETKFLGGSLRRLLSPEGLGDEPRTHGQTHPVVSRLGSRIRL